jgi:hypothetical protein
VINKFKNLLLLIGSTFLIFYLLITGFNLAALKLSATKTPVCAPTFCKEIVDETSYCLLSTPGGETCLKVAGWFFVPSQTLAYLLLFISFGLALYILKRFYLLQWFLFLLLLIIALYSVRVFLGAASFSLYGVLFEIQKLGLY